MSDHIIKNASKLSAIVLFGLIVPMITLWLAYQSAKTLNSEQNYNKPFSVLVSEFTTLTEKVTSPNEYALFSLVYMEDLTRKTISQRQIMQNTVINVGFAVISIGIMLGINDGGAESSARAIAVQFDFKTGSTGVVVFMMGVFLVVWSSSVKNDYTSTAIPAFMGEERINSKVKGAFEQCSKQPEENRASCFYQIYSQLAK